MINICGPINSLGYGVHTSNMLVTMYNRGLKIGIKPIGMVSGINADFQKMLFLSRFTT